MNRRAVLAVASIAAVGAAGAVPAVAAKPKPKPLKGTWSFTDTTPDPSVTTNSDAAMHCHGKVPAAPTDVNAHTLKVGGAGLLTVTGHNKLDWAMEVRDSKGNVLAGSDGTTPTDPEGTAVRLAKAGSYSVVYCNLEGEPTITADYKFTYR